MTEYALYKGDEFIDLGTADKLGKEYNLRPSFFKYCQTPSMRKRYKGKGFIAIKIDDK